MKNLYLSLLFLLTLPCTIKPNDQIVLTTEKLLVLSTLKAKIKFGYFSEALELAQLLRLLQEIEHDNTQTVFLAEADTQTDAIIEE